MSTTPAPIACGSGCGLPWPMTVEDALCDALLLVFSMGEPTVFPARDAVRDHAVEIIKLLAEDGVHLVERHTIETEDGPCTTHP